MPLPFIYARFFVYYFGETETVMRLSSALMAPLAVLGTGLLAVRIGLRQALAPLIVLCAAHPYWQNIGTEFRYMMPLVATSAFFCWAVVRMVQGNARMAAVAVVVSGGLALLLHPSAQFIWMALMAFTLWTWRRGTYPGETGIGPFLRHRFAPLLAALLCSVPFLLIVGEFKRPGDSVQGELSVTRALVNQVETYFGDDSMLEFATGIDDDLFTLPSIAVYVAALFMTGRFFRRRPHALAGPLLVSTLVGVPVAILCYSLFVADKQGPARYVAFTSIPIVLVLACAWQEARELGRAGIAWRAAAVFAVAINLFAQSVNQGTWHRETIAWMVANRSLDQPILTATRWMNIRALDFHGVHWSDGYVWGLSSVDDSFEEAYLRLGRGLDGADRIWLLLYHEGKVPVRKVLRRLREEGRVTAGRVYRPTEEVTLLALARTEKGAKELRELPEFPLPWAGREFPESRGEWDEFNTIGEVVRP